MVGTEQPVSLPAAFGAAGGMALVRHGARLLLRRLDFERPLAEFVNALFADREPYAVLRAFFALAIGVKIAWGAYRIQSRQGLKASLIDSVAPWLKKLPPVKAQLDKELMKTLAEARENFSKELTQPRRSLPTEGMSEEQVTELMRARKRSDATHWSSGKVLGAVYHEEDRHTEFVGRIFGEWGYTNALHTGVFPALRQMESEVVQMVVSMYRGGPEACGVFTTGGTESILLAVKGYRDWGRVERGISEPNIVVCSTAHAAFYKAGSYFNVLVKEARADDKMRIDARHVRRLVDRNTVAIVGSCCQYTHGSVDPIEELAEIALKRGVGLHVDCCMGGFLVPFMDQAGFPMRPFDFRVKGVSSISCDPHKYGITPKGASVLMFSNSEWQHHAYFYLTNWSGGIYATPTMTGTRAGGPVAATWAGMCRVGELGYVEITRRIVDATRELARGIEEIAELCVIGEPLVCIVAFGAREGSGVNCYAIADCMKKRYGWELSTCQRPACVHMGVTLTSSRNITEVLANLKECVAEVKANPALYTSTAGLYGMAAALPPTFLEDAAAAYLDAMCEAHMGQQTGDSHESDK